MKAPRAPDYVDHRPAAIDRLHEYCAGLDQDMFERKSLVHDAVIRNIEVIGEAARNLVREAPDVAAANPQIMWRELAGMRNRLTHGYADVDLALVWLTVQRDLPVLRDRLRRLDP
jgi:uncharacterized protein with HEPN domain